jgi:phenylalanyl-tRNA synthetase alpha chain
VRETENEKENYPSENDYRLEGKKIKLGNVHPITKTIEEIQDIFSSLGYQNFDGPEVEKEEYNFDRLNIPENHPARGMHDTFYLNKLDEDGKKLLLRTHTSNTQIHVLEKNSNKELKIISCGKVYRRDEDDSTHTHQFNQLEGFVVGKNISFSHLKGTLEFFLKKMFGENTSIRFRPSYFPFTEPSIEVDAECIRCLGKGCNICKNSGWVEILGAGLIHRSVLDKCGFDKNFSGFAFGLGIERMIMIKKGVRDIREFYCNNTKFLEQFK